MTNCRFGQEVCLSTYDICSPTCPFLLTLMLGSSLKTPLAQKKGACQTQCTYSFYERVSKHHTIHKTSSSKEAPQIAFCVLFSLLVSVCKIYPLPFLSWGGS